MTTFQIHNPVIPQTPKMEEAPTFLSQTLTNILTIMFIGAGVTFFFMFAVGGIKWIISGGDKEKIEAAKKQISSAIIGLVLIFLIFAVVNLIEIFFGVNLFNFSLPRLIQPD
jgi:cytochrome bd-type quinol oxidase subunit 2